MTYSEARPICRPLNAVITIADTGEVVDLNDGAERLFGARREQALHKPLGEVLAAAGLPAPELEELGRALSEDPSRLLDREFELTAPGPGGRAVPAELTIARVGGGSRRLIVWIRDLSARRIEEAESVRRLAMLERAEQIGGIGSWDWNLRGGEIRWSDNLFRLYGLDPGALRPTFEDVLERTHADDRDRVRHVAETAAATGHLGVLEYRIVRADHAVRRLQSTVASVEVEDGVPRRLVGNVQDVTEQRQIAREIAGHTAIQEVIAAWVPMQDGPERLLARLGEAMEFGAGVLWIRRDDVLGARSVWISGSPVMPGFEIAARVLDSAPGQALALEAWHSRQPVIVSLGDAPRFVVRDAAVGAGTRGAIALPAVSGDRTHAVLEFYSRETLQATETLMRSLWGMGQAVGRFLAHRRGELRPPELTAREREVLQLAALGMSGREMARELSLSPSTVKTHFENIYAKWGPGRTPAVAKALREGLIE